MIRDKIVLYNNYDDLNIKCYSCNESYHTFLNCRQTHFIPDEEKILKSFCFDKTQIERKSLKRRKKKNRNFFHNLENYKIVKMNKHNSDEKMRINFSEKKNQEKNSPFKEGLNFISSIFNVNNSSKFISSKKESLKKSSIKKFTLGSFNNDSKSVSINKNSITKLSEMKKYIKSKKQESFLYNEEKFDEGKNFSKFIILLFFI